MPKETFLNLLPDKRSRIEEAAIDEFIAYPYDAAGINRIVEKAGIPKGSFYQYFEDKKDLYLHLLGRIVERKLEYLAPVMENPFQKEFFSLLREIYGAGLRFALSNPRLQRIGTRILADRNNPVLLEFLAASRGKSDVVYRRLLEAAIARGEIRRDIDIPMSAHLISELSQSVADYYLEREGARYDESYMEYVDRMIDFLRNGIGVPPDRGGQGDPGERHQKPDPPTAEGKDAR